MKKKRMKISNLGNLSIVSYMFIVAQFLDVVTTLLGFSLGFSELNPIGNLLGMWYLFFLKFWVVFISVLILERMNKKDKYYWVLYLVPVVASIPVILNTHKIVSLFA